VNCPLRLCQRGLSAFGLWKYGLEQPASEFNLLHSEAREKKVTVGQVSRPEEKKIDLIKIKWSRPCMHRIPW
jgi:hypothetical protein